MKKLILNVWAEEIADSNIRCGKCGLDAGQVARIKHLAQMAKALNVGWITLFDGSLELFEVDYCDDDELIPTTEHTDCERLSVSPKDFWWEGGWKHGQGQWESDMVSVAELDSDEPFDVFAP